MSPQSPTSTMTPNAAHTLFQVLTTSRSLEVAALVIALGPVDAYEIQRRLRGPANSDVRAVRQSLRRLHLSDLVSFRSGKAGLFMYFALPTLRALLDAVAVTPATFAPEQVRPPEPVQVGVADGPEMLGL